MWKWLWGGAWLLLLVHVLAAFHFEHAWSHQHAWQHTADQTSRTVGLRLGAGLLFNELFLVWWAADIWQLARRPDAIGTRFHRATVWLCVFMLFNATVVFGPRWWMAVAIPAGTAGVVLFCQRSKSDGSH